MNSSVDMSAVLPFLVCAGCLLAGFIVRPILIPLLSRIARTTAARWDDTLLDVIRAPLAPATSLVLFQIALEAIPSTRETFPVLPRLLGPAWTILAAWVSLRTLGAVEAEVTAAMASAGSDNLRQRALATQTRVIRRILSATIVFLAVALCLLHFEEVRRLGTGMLASAGIAGVVLGISAQKALGNLLAGVQLAFSQPIRLDDVVVVENEWGRIEEITLTYVVVRIWDRRTLVLPISYFLEKPFQNWTRTTSSIIGTVTLEVDHEIEVEPVRTELERIVKEDPLWDGDVCVLQVTEATARSASLRALVSSSDSGRCWDLRCNVREGMLAFLRREHPDTLPKIRLDLNRKTSGTETQPSAMMGRNRFVG